VETDGKEISLQPSYREAPPPPPTRAKLGFVRGGRVEVGQGPYGKLPLNFVYLRKCSAPYKIIFRPSPKSSTLWENILTYPIDGGGGHTLMRTLHTVSGTSRIYIYTLDGLVLRRVC
jgi:hypothetical protein